MKSTSLAGILFLAACGRVSGDSPDGGDPIDANVGTYQLSIGSPDVTGYRGSTIPVTLTIDRSGGFTGEVSLELVTPPNGFTATFEPNPVPGNVTSVVAQLATPRVIGGNPTALTVRATSALPEQTLDLSLTLNSLTVTGDVTNPFGSTPSPGITVEIPGAGAPVAANADGTFTIANSHVPYDVIVRASGHPGATMYVGLTKASPILKDETWFGLGPPIGPHSQDVDITLAGITQAECTEASVDVWFTFAGKQYRMFGNAPTWTTSCKKTGDIYWDMSAAASGTATFHVISGIPAGPYKHGSQSLTIDDAASTPTAFTVTAAAVPTLMLEGVVEIPPMASSLTLLMMLEQDGQDVVELFRTTATGEATFPKPVPQISGTTYGVSMNVMTTSGGRASLYRDLLLTGFQHDFRLPAPSDPSAPADGATGIDEDTVFSWSPHGTGSTYRLRAESVTDCGSDPEVCAASSFTIYTAATSTTLPVLSNLPDGAYDWQIHATRPLTVDQAASNPSGFGNFNNNTTFSTSIDNEFRFTFAP